MKCPVYSGTPLCGHLGDLVKCPVYSGTLLLWTPWGPGEVSYIEQSTHFMGKFMLSIFGTQRSALIIQRCSYFRGVH